MKAPGKQYLKKILPLKYITGAICASTGETIVKMNRESGTTPLSPVERDEMAIDIITSFNEKYYDGPTPKENDFATGGKVSFEDKVNSISENLVGKEVPRKYRKEYGDAYTESTAREAATKIAGAIKRDEGYAWGGAPVSSGDVVQPVFENGGQLIENDASVTIDATKLLYQIKQAEKRKDKKAIEYLSQLQSVSNEIGKFSGMTNLNVAKIKFSDKILNVPTSMIDVLSFAKGGKITKDEKASLLSAAMYLSAYKNSKFNSKQVAYYSIEKIISTLKTDPTDYSNLNLAILNLYNYRDEISEGSKKKDINKVIAPLRKLAGENLLKNLRQISNKRGTKDSFDESFDKWKYLKNYSSLSEFKSDPSSNYSEMTKEDKKVVHDYFSNNS